MLFDTIPAYQKFHVGSIEVVALYDGYLNFPEEAVFAMNPTFTPEEVRSSGQPLRDHKFQFPVVAFVIRCGSHSALIDAGSADLLGPTAGVLLDSLGRAGIVQDDIDTVLLTHPHPDHVGALTDAEGRAVFRKAELVLSQADFDWLHDPASVNALASEAMKVHIGAAIDRLKAYQGRTRLTPPRRTEVLPGVEIVPLPGHTPGHSGFLLQSGDEQALIWGDLAHLTMLQLRHPNIRLRVDVDPDGAVSTRIRVFDWLASDAVPVIGSHAAFPGLGQVIGAEPGYRFVPLGNAEY